MWVCREDTKVLKRNPPEKGEETGIAMDNMKPSGSCPEKIEVVDVVVVECYCFLIKIIVVGVEPRRDALVYMSCEFFLKISIGLAKRLACQSMFVVVVRRFL